MLTAGILRAHFGLGSALPSLPSRPTTDTTLHSLSTLHRHNVHHPFTQLVALFPDRSPDHLFRLYRPYLCQLSRLSPPPLSPSPSLTQDNNPFGTDDAKSVILDHQGLRHNWLSSLQLSQAFTQVSSSPLGRGTVSSRDALLQPARQPTLGLQVRHRNQRPGAGNVPGKLALAPYHDGTLARGVG